MTFKRCVLTCALLVSASICSFGQNLYVSDTDRVDVFSPTGDFLYYISVGSRPTGLAFDSAGSLYIASGFEDHAIITKIDSEGHQSVFASGGLLGGDPEGIAFDSLGNLYVATHLDAEIIKITPNGTQSLFASFATGDEYYGLAFSSFDGDLYATAGNAIYQFTLQGTRTLVTHIPGAGPIAIDAIGNLYIAGDDPSIYRVTPQGVTTTFALNARSQGLTFNVDGSLYSSNHNNFPNSTVDKYDAAGVATTFISGLNDPEFLVFGPPIPEPSTQLLLLIGAATSFAIRRFVRPRHTGS